ncbi:coilin-like [Parambassis ranga]|uniref:Coilin-like n=1 Tax=Parambassis ranga TaxID=210632 RepID=A0A6P7HL57_9TELE|nr:coilin-like [Parambassis ranga]
MAAHSTNVIRLRLYFDYPPPAVTGHRMCWLLVDLNACRVVADLESIIREKFEFGRGSILNLFIEDCYLPHTESIYVVRDSDSVKVKLDCLPQLNGHTASETCRKRRRATEEEEDRLGDNGVNVDWTTKKRKKRTEQSLTEAPEEISGEDKTKASEEKQSEKKRKKKKAEKNAAVTPKPAASPKKHRLSVDPPVNSTKKRQVAQAKSKKASSSESSSGTSSEEDEAPKKPATKTPSSTPAASKTNTKPAPQRKAASSPVSSSDTDSSSDEDTSVNVQPKNKPSTPTAPSVQPSLNCPQAAEVDPPQENMPEAHESDSEEEIQLVIKRPLPQHSVAVGGQSAWRGRGRGKAGNRGAGGQGGRGAGRGHGGRFESSFNGDKELSYQTDSLTNKSVILQNGSERAPKPDYSSMPLLAAPPQVGQKIAFKLLELTENYTPEVSEYKEAKLVSFDPTSRQTELELLNVCQAPVAPGKFDLVYQNPDGSERVEYTLSRESWVTERWESLLEPRLVM